MVHAPILSPHGVLTLGRSGDVLTLPPGRDAPLETAFARGSGHGLLRLGADEIGTPLPGVLSYWRDFGARYVTALCACPGLNEGGGKSALPLPDEAQLDQMARSGPPMVGAEYLTSDTLAGLWRAMDRAFGLELSDSGLSAQDFLRRRNPAWNLVGRVYFNLAENRRDDAAPFAFLATYTARLSADAKAQHLPLGKALQEYAGARNRQRLLSLLMPIQRAAEACAWLKAMVDTKEIFHPLRWTPAQALQLLKDIPAIEGAGVVVRMPTSWRMNRPARPQVTAKIGTAPPAKFGLDALLDFRMDLTLDGEVLSAAEIKQLLAESDGLALVRGKWVEIDRERLRETLAQFQDIERRAADEGLSFRDAMRLLAGVDTAARPDADPNVPTWSQTVAGPWLAETLASLRQPRGRARIEPGPSLHGRLRPYQQAGLQWLYLLARLGLGACLADDMGLGKTVQVLSLALVFKGEANGTRKPSLLIAPASLLANWSAEIARFAPGLETLVVHPSARAPGQPASDEPDAFARCDLVMTSYGLLARTPALADTAWRLVVLDEAQAIKNPNARQTRAVKQLKAEARIALTGTPIENRLGDLWSIFDFINPGLLGSAAQFSAFAKRLAERPHNPYAPLRNLVAPYILRRLKTDKSIIADLPDKTEVDAFCNLSRKQAALYQQAVDDLADRLDATDGMKRRGLVLAFLMRLKQICNHPSQWLGDGAWSEGDSGKFARLREIAEVAAARQEKMLVFTQFKEIATPLAGFLAGVFGQPGVVLHGATDVKKRGALVRRFQDDDAVPFFVLSLKAGGTGLNLTAASHVVHFDRWWNPAVENQATDRAFRIGQTKNVLVHKFVCRGTVEDRINSIIESKSRLAVDLLAGGGDTALTDMKDDELLRLVALDLNAAVAEGEV